MDKFSLFKLLNSFSKLLTEKEASPSKDEGEVLSSLLSATKKEPPLKKKPNPSSSYLKAVKSHQEFVKRVVENPLNKK